MKRTHFLYSATAIFLGFVFFGAGMSKLWCEHKFPGLIGPVWLAERLEEYGLGLFGQFIAVAQITIGFMVITPRYRTLGAVMLIPMIVNILMVTISMQWRGTPYVLGFFLLLNTGLLVHDVPWLLHFITGRPHVFPVAHPARRWKGHVAWLAGLALVFCGIALSYLVFPLAYFVVLGGFVLSWFSRRADAWS